MSLSLEEIREKAVPILEDYGVERAAVFGSYARGEETEDSDVDLLVRIDDDLSLLDVSRLKIELEDVLGKEVDIVEEEAVKPRMKEYIEEDQVAIV